MFHPATAYALEVVNGNRVAGLLEIAACQRHLDDLARAGTDDFPWVFDEDKANVIYTWFSFCCHVEGELAGKPIELLPFQKFDLGVIFGWVHRETGLRRFEKAYIQEARKNGKSATMSGIGLYLMAGDREEAPQVYCAAVDRGQARIVWRAAKTMAQKSPDIRKRIQIKASELIHRTRGGFMVPLSRETMNKDGFNPSGAIIDEYHAHATSEIYDLIWSAWGQRAQALMMIITTAGFEITENPCYKEYEYCKGIVQKTITPANERYFVMIRQMDDGDDEHDPANWIKANPLRAATSRGLAKIKEQHDEAFGSKDPAKIRNFRVKNLNIWVNEKKNGYIGEYILQWEASAVTPEEFARLTQGLVCNVGVDLSKKIDLTADGFVFELPDGRIAMTARGFMPEEALSRHEKTDQVPYRAWVEGGWLIVTQGNVTDYTRVQTHIQDMELEHGWKVHEMCFDPYNATHFANVMAADGYTCIEIRQGVQTLSEPTKFLREKIADGLVVHDGSPLLKWSLANAVAEQDSNENIKLSKKNASDTQRIDPVAAIVNALVRWLSLHEASRDLNAEILSDEWGM